ncbi:MAG: hypothetical protein MJA32_06240, partial [Proteobacteria bacterium]|nr:hypothetical protein [Pseudomonadota bacterium]
MKSCAGFLPLLICSTTICGAAAGEEITAITGVRMYASGSGELVDDVVIVMQDGKIAAAGHGVGIPPSASVVEADGRIVTPAFMNSATRLGLVEVSSVAETVDYAQESGASAAAFEIQYALNAESELVGKARTEGLAYAISYPAGSGSTAFSGLGALLRMGSKSMTVERPRAALYARVGGKDT